MITVAGLLVAGGTIYAARKVYHATAGRFTVPWLKPANEQLLAEAESAQPIEQDQSLDAANRAVILSSTSLGLAAAGLFLKPVLIVASLPVTIYIFIPTFQSAYHSLRQERRITTAVLDATRVTVCLLMGYHWAAALNAWLQTLNQKLMTQGEVDFKQTLQRYAGEVETSAWRFGDGVDVEIERDELLLGDVIAVDEDAVLIADGRVIYGSALVDERLVTGQHEAVRKEVGDLVHAATRLVSGSLYIQVTAADKALITDAVRTTLQETVDRGAYTQQWGEESGQRAAPRMLGVFALLLPFWNVNRAAGFLTTSFGAQMRTLSPFTIQMFVALAAEQEILIKDSRALERLILVNTVMIDATTLLDEHGAVDDDAIASAKRAIHTLRQRFWPIQAIAKHKPAIYLVGTQEEEARRLAALLGCDDYFVEPYASGRLDLLERLQASGRITCYIGNGLTQATVMEKAFVSISLAGAASVAEDVAPLIFSTKDLTPLANVFALATQFMSKQGFNLAWPLLMDLVDIGTTVFWHMGLVYSICFNYSGLLLSTLNARAPLRHYQRQQSTQAAHNAAPPTDERAGEIVLFASPESS